MTNSKESIPLDTSGGYLNPKEVIEQAERERAYEALTAETPMPAETGEVIKLPSVGPALVHEFFELRKYAEEFGGDKTAERFGQIPEDVRQELVKRLTTDYLNNPRNPRTHASVETHLDNMTRAANLENALQVAEQSDEEDPYAEAYRILLDRATEYIKRMAENELDKAA